MPATFTTKSTATKRLMARKNPLELKVLGSSLESQRAPDKGSGGNPGIRQGKKLGNHLQFETAKMQQCSRIFCLLGLGLVIFVGPKKHFGRKVLSKKKYHQFLKLQPLTIDLICLVEASIFSGSPCFMIRWKMMNNHFLRVEN